VIDGLLCLSDVVSGEEADELLDLRWMLRRRSDAEATLRLFCKLRLRMEHRHYLAFFRIRRWLENNISAHVSVTPIQTPEAVELKLDHYCVEAIRRVCLCASLSKGLGLLASRLEFVFRPEKFQLQPVDCRSEVIRAANTATV
jgi:hypothetical protein